MAVSKAKKRKQENDRTCHTCVFLACEHSIHLTSFQHKLQALNDVLTEPVFELPGGLGVEPPPPPPRVVCSTPPPNKMPWDTLGGQFQPHPPPLLMMLSRLCVMTMTMNRQMSTPTYFLTIQTLDRTLSYATEIRSCIFMSHNNS
jgi:hypothetical protein